MKKLKLTPEGAKKLKEEIETKKEELRKLGQYKVSAAENEGDAWHDNFAFEQTEIQERGLMREISDLQHQLDLAEIIEVTKNENRVNIGSKVTVLMKFSEDDEEEYTFTLESTGNRVANIISINSPLGGCVFEKETGYQGEYHVNGNIIKVTILSIEN